MLYLLSVKNNNPSEVLLVMMISKQMKPKGLVDLPDEILRSICFFIDWRDALSLRVTNRRFQDVTDDHLLWRHYCQINFKYWAKSHQIYTKVLDPSFVQWKPLFRKRHVANTKTRAALANIIATQKARTPKIESIVGFDYDAKDVLLQNHATNINLDDHLARRYGFHAQPLGESLLIAV